MNHDIIDVIKNIQDIYENNSSLAVLKDFERVLDEMDVYVYENWIDGELAYGPKVDRHWIKVGFMWPHDKMPNPIGGKRLTEIGCKVTYQKSHLLEPRKIRTEADIRPGSKKGRIDRHQVWIVEVQMPKKIAFDIYKGYMNKMKNQYKGNDSKSEGQAQPAAPVAAPVAGVTGTPAPQGALGANSPAGV